MDCILLDYSKAFDKVPHKKVPHQRLLLTLHYYGVRGPTREWIKSFLHKRTQQFLVNGKSSKQAPVLSDVPRGTVLGPLVFLAYVNGMPACMTSNIKPSADDSLLYRRISSGENSVRLHENLDKLQEWEKTWVMSFHLEKFEVLRITNKTKPIISDYRIHGHKLSLAINHIPKSKQQKARQVAAATGERFTT